MSKDVIWTKHVNCVYAAKRVGETNPFVVGKEYTIDAKMHCTGKVVYSFTLDGQRREVYCAEHTLASERYVICRDDDAPWLGILAEFKPI